MQIDHERARLFDAEAERYDRSRPGYPSELIDEVLGPSAPGLSVLDVGCGTGIAARAMAQRGAEVLGVELNAGMARIAERHGVATEVARFEAWDPAGRTFDRVTCAQAWHWLDPEMSTDKAASLLRAGGRICLFWNVGHQPDDLAEVLLAVYRRALGSDLPRLMRGYGANGATGPTAALGDVAEALDACDRLTGTQMTSFEWSRMYSRDQWLDQLPSHSDHAALAPDVRESLLGEVGRAIDRYGGAFRMTYATVLVSAWRA